MTNPDTTFEMLLPRPVEAVWLTFRDPELVKRWYGWEFDGLEEEVKAFFVDGAVVDRDAGTIHIGGHLFTFTPQDSNTHVRVERRQPAFGAGSEADWTQDYDDIEEGWISFLQQCRFHLARHPQERRRTIHRAGAARSAIPMPLGDLLGLSDAFRTPAGEPYVSDAGPGDHLEGEVWYRTGLQLGVTVDAWGDGLLILSHSPSAKEPFSLVSLTLTTYGMADEAFADLERRWTKWFDARFEES
ncbi:MAG: SRPBCC family protein [Sporichthyaceae bacterium]